VWSKQALYTPHTLTSHTLYTPRQSLATRLALPQAQYTHNRTHTVILLGPTFCSPRTRHTLLLHPAHTLYTPHTTHKNTQYVLYTAHAFYTTHTTSTHNTLILRTQHTLYYYTHNIHSLYCTRNTHCNTPHSLHTLATCLVCGVLQSA